MTHSNKSTNHPQAELTKRIIVGGGIGVLLISLFLIPSEAKPEWGPLWMIRPLIITPLAGALGGLANYIILHYYNIVGIHKWIARILSIIVPAIGLYLGFVLGLDGTMWD
jgi:hypothetical protein